MGSEHSRKEPFEQLVNGYSEILHMSPRMPRHTYIFISNYRTQPSIVKFGSVVWTLRILKNILFLKVFFYLRVNPHLSGEQQPGGGVPLSPGQLPDVSPNAVRVIQKDVQGKQEIRPLAMPIPDLDPPHSFKA